MEPTYRCAKCGASVAVDADGNLTRECEHADAPVILDMGEVILVGAASVG